jgi:hypothetical protein
VVETFGNVEKIKLKLKDKGYTEQRVQPV